MSENDFSYDSSNETKKHKTPQFIPPDLISEKKPTGESSGKPAPSSLNHSKEPPYKIREYVSLFLALVLADVCLYKGGGFAGFALLFFMMPMIVFAGAGMRKRSAASCVIAAFLLIIALRSLYLGNAIITLTGIILIYAFAYSMTGRRILHENTIQAILIMVIMGVRSLFRYGKNIKDERGQNRIALIIVPLVFVIVFAFIFIMANPVLKDSMKDFYNSLDYFIPNINRIIFWIVMLILVAGLLRPPYELLTENKKSESIPEKKYGNHESSHYAITRNTIIALIILFAVYFVFEFYYLWIRPIPDDFRYSEYAHQGAAWLTFALAFATLIIWLVFNKDLMRDDRISNLKKIVWIWCAENFVLALCAFHRTQIYVHYNGFSRMRVLAVFGIATVVAGFILVVWKVAHAKKFKWLIRRQIMALLIALILYLVTPVDYIVTKYNVSRIMKGDYAPTVQIAAHDVGIGGVPALIPLLDSDKEVISEGIAALLRWKYEYISGDILETPPVNPHFSVNMHFKKREGMKWKKKGWTFYQVAEDLAVQSIRENVDLEKTTKDAWHNFYSFGMRYYD